MKTTIILMLIFIFVMTLVNADYLNTKTSNQCVYDVTPYQNNTGLCYIKRSNNNQYCNKNLRHKHLIDGYHIENGECNQNEVNKVTGLTSNQLNEQSFIAGNFIGFTFLFFIVYLVSITPRRF